MHRIQACTGQSSGFSIEIATWRITTAATKATGTVLTDADEVLSFEAMLRAYNETRLFFIRSKIAATRIDHLWLIRPMETKEAGSHLCASSAKSKVTGLLHALRQPIFKQWLSSSKERPTSLHTRPRTTLSLTAS